MKYFYLLIILSLTVLGRFSLAADYSDDTPTEHLRSGADSTIWAPNNSTAETMRYHKCVSHLPIHGYTDNTNPDSANMSVKDQGDVR